MKNHVTNLKECISPVFKGFITLLLLVIFNFSVSAGRNSSEDKIKLQIENGTIKEALKKIEKQCNFTFIYNDASINVNQIISVTCEGKALNDLLDEILGRNGIRYTFVDNHIVLTNASILQQEKKTIRGNVKDAETGEGLPGVTIVEKGTSNGTITDVNGNFSLVVADNAVIQVSYVGYKTQEINVTGQADISVVLNSEVVSLSEIVVIGYGTVKKSDLTGAVASVSSDEIRLNVGSGIDQALQGRTAGVSVTTNSGTPGASPLIRIRGIGTITNSDPFFVVDGVPVSAESIGMLNPGDIESTEVLKDASAAAIYGARAANGVVLITTKRAKEGKSLINFDAYTGVQSVAKKHDLMTAKEWVELRNATGAHPVLDPSTVESTDWQDAIFRKAKINSAQLSISSGTEKTNYVVSGSYFKQEGIIKGSDYERYTLRVNSSSKIKPWLDIGENIAFGHAKYNLIPEQNEWTSVVIQALTMDPTTPVYNEEGNPSGAIRNNIGNPVGTIERNHNVLRSNQLLGNAYFELKPFSWLSFKSSIGAEISQHENEQFFPVFYESTTINQTVNNLFNGLFKFNSLVFEHLLTFKKSFADKHNVQFLLGYSRQQSVYRLALSRIDNVPESDDLWFLSNGNAETLQYEDIQGQLPVLSFPINFQTYPYDASIASILARLIYSFGNYVDLTTSVRRDGSSKFGENKRFGIFPSFALGWKISEMNFFPKNDVINFLKLRGGWGKLGNQEIGDYVPYIQVSYGMNYNFGPAGDQQTYPGGAPRGFPNRDVKWESTEQTNIGLDANLLRFKLSVNFDYFIRKTDGMLAQVPVPGLTGIQDAPFVNIGSVSNKGFELNVSYREQEGNFKYKIGFNVGHVKNEVISLGNGLPISTASFRASDFIARTEVGQPIAFFYGFETDGYYQNQAEIDSLDQKARELSGRAAARYDGRPRPGDVKIKDQNGDYQITNADKTFIGSPHPKLTYGIGIELEYKWFDFKIFGQGVYGNKVFMATKYYLESGDGYWNLLPTMKDYWKQEGDQTTVPRLGQSSQNMRMSDRYVENGSYFRIKTIQFGFTVPNSITKRIGVERMRVFGNLQNFISLHKYKGFDPEIGRGVSQLDIGIDRGMYPLAKSITAGINITL